MPVRTPNRAQVPTNGVRSGGASRLGRACTSVRGALPFSSVVVALLCTVIVCRFSSAFSITECIAFDRLLALRPPRTPDPRIVLIGIEREAIDTFQGYRQSNDHAGCTCQTVSRQDIGTVLGRIKQAGARVVVVDLLLQQRCPLHDEYLQRALNAEPGEVILTATAQANPGGAFFRDPYADFVASPILTPAAADSDDGGPPDATHPPRRRVVGSPLLYSAHGVIRGASLLQEHIPSEIDIKEIGPVQWISKVYVPISLGALVAFRGTPNAMPEALSPEMVRCCDTDIPVLRDIGIYLMGGITPDAGRSRHVMLINWAGPNGTFPMYSLRSVRDASAASLRRWFEGKVVLLGSAAERVDTPLTGRAPSVSEPMLDQSADVAMTGLEAHANAVNTLLQQRFLRPIPTRAAFLTVLLCALLTALAFRFLPTIHAGLAAALLIAILFVAGYVFILHDLWFYTVIPSVAVVSTSLLGGLCEYARSRREAEELAETIETRDTATQVIVHDLKQPLASISALAAVIRLKEQNGGNGIGAAEMVERIMAQVDRALGDIDELLATNPDRELSLHPTEFDMSAFVSDIAVAQGHKSPVHDIDVRAPAGLIPFTGDQRYLGRALSNLLDNAIKYWPDGGTIIVQVAPLPDQLVIRIIDGGIGMELKAQEKVFERFHRAVPEGIDIPGTGIGLYSVKRIVEAHGGSIECESAPGVGSTFTVRLPCSRARAQEEVAG